jgi:toxin ParE1/3/4
MKLLNFHPEAENEINVASNYYNFKDLGLGFDFLDEIDNALLQIKKSPERWVKMSKKIRKFFLRRFPYTIFYEIIENSINILAVSHQKQKPGYWEGRI